MSIKLCDLCHYQQPSFYCSSDSAFLCTLCDAQVHAANFLVARHVRLSLSPPLCTSSSSSSSSACVSSTHCSTSSPPPKTKTIRDWKTREVLVNWCRRLGVNSSSVIEVATHAFEAKRWVWPYRVGLAASLWMGLGVLRLRKEKMIRRLQEISGVPAKSILVAEAKLEGIMKHRHQHYQNNDDDDDEEGVEGWAEC